MIAIRPPEYFPRLEYAALMLVADCFIMADTFQYSRQSFQNRTKVRNPQGWQWVSVPLKGRQHGRPMFQVKIRQVVGWQRRHWRAFHYNYRATPFFEYYEAEFAPLFQRSWTSLADFTCASVELLHRLLGLTTPLLRASTLEGQPSSLVGLLEQSGSPPLVVPPTSASYDAKSVQKLHLLRYEHPHYRQNFDGFEPGMSTFDLLFNYGPEATSILSSGIQLEAYTE